MASECLTEQHLYNDTFVCQCVMLYVVMQHRVDYMSSGYFTSYGIPYIGIISGLYRVTKLLKIGLIRTFC